MIRTFNKSRTVTKLYLYGPLTTVPEGLSSPQVLALVPPGSTPRNQQEEKDIMRLLRDETSWGRTLTVGRHDGPLIGLLSPLTLQSRPSRPLTLRHLVSFSPVSCSIDLSVPASRPVDVTYLAAPPKLEGLRRPDKTAGYTLTRLHPARGAECP